MVCPVYTQLPADNNFHIYFKFTNSPNRFNAFEIEIQRPGKESNGISLLSDCLLSAIFDGTFRVQKGMLRIAIQTVNLQHSSKVDR